MHETISAVAVQIAGEIRHHGADTITLAVVRAYNADEGWATHHTVVRLSDAEIAAAYRQALALAPSLGEY